MNSPFCEFYCGVSCVNGSCPKIDNRYFHCIDCLLYKGCDDCCFREYYEFCPKLNVSEVSE